MKRGFVRTLWGKYGDNRRLFKCRSAMDFDLELLLNNKYEDQLNAITYVFGSENYKQLIDIGFKCEMVDKRPIVWGEEPDVSMFRHKLETYEMAASEFDEFVFLDLDCMLIKPLPEDFWEACYKKEKIQGSLMTYKKRKATWRKIDARKIPCACYMYFRDKMIPWEMIKLWDDKKSWSEEMIAARYIDIMTDGWKGMDYYWNHFEPDFYSMSKNRAYNEDKGTEVFYHFHVGKEVTDQLQLIKNGKKPEWAR